MKIQFSGPWKWNALDGKWTAALGVIATVLTFAGPKVIELLNEAGGWKAKLAAPILVTVGTYIVRLVRNNKP